MKFPSSIGMITLAIYLVLVGLIGVFGISLGQLSIVVPVLALIAGIAILVGR
ncbi:hypothetical protein WJU23_18850 [Prosthecobacter sp. SYSU 5D2]|uniref:hypothetical protein n=1 Tax=Prosthecobacter sp. SYSU 5D2 TaxID=3134134 RepID=UPI0031FE8B68